MDKITIIAIDRAESEVGRAAKKLAENLSADVSAYMLVNHSYIGTPAYKGDETNGFFKEVVCDFNDTYELTKILNDICEGQVILHCRLEEAIQDYQKVIALLNNPYTQTVESLELSTKKYKMRKAISSKYPEICPKFVQIESQFDLNESLIQNFKFPVIIKPNGLHSSFFVTKCNNYNEVEENVNDIFEKLKSVYEREYGTGKPSLVIEEFMEGEMYSIDAYVTHNNDYYFLPIIRVVTAAELGLDGYYSYRHIVPTDLNEEEIAKANKCAKKGMEALGLKSSTTHVELYKTPDGWKIIEIGPRIGGYRQELYLESFGIDHYYNDLLIHSGKEPIVTHSHEKHAAGLNIYADYEGTILSIEGVEEAQKLPSVVSLKCHVAVGDKAVFASNGGQFLVDGILSNQNKEELEADVATVRSLIKFKIQE
ncbi:MAG: ATP-grasp domain-containing protein [Candidatus Saccharibacteria bacterium]|nr:ATP-grasp domain-containing protein [Candidatus Saccharibacteria bacterium]